MDDSHLGTRRGGLVVRNSDGLRRAIHDLSSAQFRSKSEPDLPGMYGHLGLGVISDFEDQPLIIGSHHGVYSLVTVGRVWNIEELATAALRKQTAHFSEITRIGFNPTELIASLINQGDTIPAGIGHAQDAIDGSASMLLLTDDGVIAARDKWGRTPVVLGRKEGAWAATMESCALHNLGYTIDRQLGPGEVVRLTPAGPEQLVPPGNELQICSFLWIYYATRLPSTYAKLEKNGEAHLADYANADTDRYAAMVEQIRQQIGLTTLQYQRLDDMVEAIGMPADKVCTYCSGLTQTNGVAFDNDRCLAEQSQAIRERIDSFGGKLYLEFGGKLLFDYHASRVLPGFDRRGTRRVCAASA